MIKENKSIDTASMKFNEHAFVSLTDNAINVQLFE